MTATLEVDTAVSLDTAQASAQSISVTAQTLWAQTPLKPRLRILKAARHCLAGMTADLAAAISPALARTPADTRVAEILPLLAACRFLEDFAEALLTPRKLGRTGRPLWLAGVTSKIHRAPLGHILVIGPANYPLFLPGVQALQALAAGNAVTWKPGTGGRAVATLFAKALHAAGLPAGLLHITAESIEAAQAALRERPAKVFFTGSATTGRALMRQLAETLTPSVMELSGCDAVIVLPSASLPRVVTALTFGMRLNGSATCMAPRRVLLVDATPARRNEFLQALRTALQQVPGVELPATTRHQLRTLLADAHAAGAIIEGDDTPSRVRPILVINARPTMQLAQADLFAPVVSIIEVAGEAGILAAETACPYALTTAIFGDEATARRLAPNLTSGTVLINDLIVPTADPRVPFGGRRKSGFGVTRGTEGLLEMTAPKTVLTRRGTSTRHYEATTPTHESLFDGIIAATHAATWSARWQGVMKIISSGRTLAARDKTQDTR